MIKKAPKPLITDDIRAVVDAHASNFDQLPCVVIIHDLVDWSVVYMSQRGLDLLNVTMEEITAISAEEYFSRYFNYEHASDYVPNILGMLERNNNDEFISHLQQVRFRVNGDWHWHMASCKIFMRDEQNQPRLTITIAMPVNDIEQMAAKAERLLKENIFLRANYQQFNQLTKREREIMRLTALGKSATEIASELFIAGTTVETHRRNLKNKLQVTTHFELSEYARAFDLI